MTPIHEMFDTIGRRAQREDVACLVFLEHYAFEFSKRTDPEKLAGILAKTWKKMSSLGHEHACKLACAPEIAALLKQLRAA